MVRCLVGRIEGVTAISVNGSIAGGKAELDEDLDVDVAVVLSAIVRRRVPARVLGL
jgi:predicted nucleotidyltransferase